MHTIVDGIVDADRIDCVLRDTKNSGVNWGKISLDRLIKPAKFLKIPLEEEEKAEK